MLLENKLVSNFKLVSDFILQLLIVAIPKIMEHDPFIQLFKCI